MSSELDSASNPKYEPCGKCSDIQDVGANDGMQRRTGSLHSSPGVSSVRCHKGLASRFREITLKTTHLISILLTLLQKTDGVVA
jgi:hypothetical protein